MMVVDRTAPNPEKIKLFRSLFVGREDVFARRYENAKKGTSGYSPCCQNQWGAGCVLRQHKKCSECPVRQYVPVSDEVVRWHLRGKDASMKPFVMGIYPMAPDETVRFAVIDFDESSWRRDALFVVRKSRDLGLFVATGSCLGEGFDDARLDTLFFAQPILWRGRLTRIAAYRRRRREDALLQTKGYRILSFLIEDVCEHLDDVLDAIAATFR